jgi:hypothetical protein
MRWDDLPQSDNIEDRRGDSGYGGGHGGGYGGGGGMGGLPIGTGGLGIGGVIVLGLIGWALGIDPRLLIGGAELATGNRPHYQQPRRPNDTMTRRTGAPTDSMGKFVAAVLGSADVTWKVVFERERQRYMRPRLVMFSRATRSACGMAQSAMGPFYCPTSREIYLDTAFFSQLERRFKGCSGKACEFAQAYVIAHEVGHHVQNLLGILPKVQQAQRAAGSRVESNRLQVRVELQADCFAGVWAHNAERKWKLVQPGDIDAALQTAAAIGDDMLQKRAQGYSVPDSFTHGSSEQRKRWFMTGYREGTVKACNTFAAASL